MNNDRSGESEHVPVPFQIHFRKLECGLTEYRIHSASNRIGELLKTLPPEVISYLAVNRNRFGNKEIVGWSAISDDLYGNAPHEIRVTDSLFVGTFRYHEWTEDQLSDLLWSRDLILFFSKLDPPELLKTQEIVWAWYSRASILQQQIVYGSSTLAKALFAGVSHGILRDDKSSDLLVYTHENM